MSDKATLTAPSYLGARANRDYARAAAYQHRATVRRIMEGGARGHAAIARELNRLAVPTSNGRAWGIRSTGLLLKRLGVDQRQWAERDLEAFREPFEELWARGVRARPQMVIGLERMGIETADGHPWTPARVGRVIGFLGLDWADGAPILQRGDTVPEVIEVPGVGEQAEPTPEPEPVAPLEPVADLPPQAAAPRRRAIRL